MLSTKNKQLDIANHERVVLIVNWALLVDRSNMIEACSLIDFSQFGNIDKVYFEVPHNGRVHLVYDRKIYAAFRPDGEPPQQIEPLFISWLANHLYRKEIQAFRLVRRITEHQKSLLWLPAHSREQLVALGEDFLKSDDSVQLHWIVENLKDDPDPSVNNAADDPEGRFNDHLRTKQGKSSRLIRTVRGRLCWLLMQMVTHPRVEDYNRIFEIVEKFATEENLYVRQHATVPMIELARRRFAKVDANTRLMSDQLANRIKALALRMVDENMAYPAVLEWVAHVIWNIQDLDHSTALKILRQLLSIDQSGAANDISSMMIYFAFFRQNQFKNLGPFNPDDVRSLLKDKLANGSGPFRATAVNHFKTILDRNEIEFDTLIPYLEAFVNGQSGPVANHHFYHITAKQAGTHPDIVGSLIEQAVLPHCREFGLPFAMMMGAKRGVNPQLKMAGDGVGRSRLAAVQALCSGFSDNQFLVTVLARENQSELCVLARKFRNLHIFGCWWFTNIPSVVEEMTRMRLELLGLSVTPQHSDARVLDQLVYKWDHSRRIIARVLTEKYTSLCETGWELADSEIERDVRDLFGGAFRRFCGR
jgi:hypothetical protein